MHPHEIHHIKSYIVFFILSVGVIGILIYLYFPMGMVENMKSSTLELTQTVGSQTPAMGSGVSEKEQNTVQDNLSGRRMRLTQMLIRSQKQLQTLEDQRKSSPQGLDPVSEQKIVKLKEKIANIERIITELK